MSDHYDVLIVGAGPAGCSLAHALASCRPKSAPTLRIAVLERSLAQPDRIVGELLQPGGMASLKKLGLEWCTEGIDAIPAHGYCVVYEGKKVEIPYPHQAEGRSFHHGPFVMQLRKAARQARGVELIEATVTELIECPHTGRALGVRANVKNAANPSAPPTSETFFAEIIVAADGGYSKFRTAALGTAPRAPVVKSHFFAAILKHAPLPMKEHGCVSLVPGCGPVLMYQIDSTETRMLADIKLPLPSDAKAHLLEKVVPGLLPELQPCVIEAIKGERLRSMPNSFLPATMQGQHGSKEGVILIGDSWNMRHPLTGGGMTVAFSDVVLLMEALRPFLQEPSPHPTSDSSPPVSTKVTVEWDHVRQAMRDWHWDRKGLSSTINILSIALYDLFSADDEELHILREGCFAYFKRGGDCVEGPVSLLAGLAPSPWLLARHFFTVAFYAIYIYWTKPQYVPIEGGQKLALRSPSVIQYPAMVIRSFMVIWTAAVVFSPLVWTEIRWW